MPAALQCVPRPACTANAALPPVVTPAALRRTPAGKVALPAQAIGVLVAGDRWEHPANHAIGKAFHPGSF